MPTLLKEYSIARTIIFCLSISKRSGDMAVLLSLWILLTASSSSLQNHVVEVCISPGCIADGAENTLTKLKALAHPSICIREGKCESLCGKGPVLIQNPDEDGIGSSGRQGKREILLKYMDSDKIVSFLDGLMMLSNDEEVVDNDVKENCIPDTLIKGYNLVEEGLDKFSQKLYGDASQLLKEGIDIAFEPAKEFGGNMEWMILAHQSLAESLLSETKRNDNDDHILLESALENISVALTLKPEDEKLYEVLGAIYQARNDLDGEYRAMSAIFDLPQMNSPNPPREVALRRRTLRFRLQKLERELNKA